jgi:CRISPR system Cascade subunit CasC
MKLELHLLQNFPPSCLNRDDTNSPKDCEFGGVRRARISSQSLKRAIRQDFSINQRVPESALAVRTKRIVERVADLVLAKRSHDRNETELVIEKLLAVAGLEVVKKEGADTKTQYLLFIPSRSIEALAAIIGEQWDLLIKAFGGAPDAKADEPKATDAKKKKNEKKAKTAGASEALGEELTSRVRALLFDASKTPELALFGRMIADKPDHNVDAACQVAHALSTHRVAMEFDFYTAVDDLKPRGDSGADMMGTIQFNSACFYRYSVLDLDQLARTLGGLEARATPSPAEKKAAVEAARAWVLATIQAIPSARQNTFAAFTPPSLVLTASRTSGNPLSLANAFVRPVRPGSGPGEDLLAESAKALGKHLDEVAGMYGKEGATFRVAALGDLPFTSQNASRANNQQDLLAAIDSDLAAWERSA